MKSEKEKLRKQRYEKGKKLLLWLFNSPKWVLDEK